MPKSEEYIDVVKKRRFATAEGERIEPFIPATGILPFDT
jgi:hypothetical protein